MMEAGLVWPRVIPDLSNVQSGGPEMTRKRVAPRESTAIASGGRERYCSFGGALYGEAVITRTVEIVVGRTEKAGMKLPNWFKIVWWIFLLIIASAYLVSRRSILLSGDANAFDNIVLIFWIALLLSPIFYEMSFFGISLRQKIADH